MKRLFFYLLVAVLSAVSVVSCSMYDDTLIWEKLNDHEQRLSELETLCDKLNSDVETMQKIVEALQNNDYITSVTPIYEGDKLIGYTILFAKSGPITIYNGADGKDGADGEDGQDGSNGQDGKDGHTPVIGVKMDTDGFYYWTVDGEWLLDENGQKVRVTGNDGKDGEDGEDGADGVNGEDGKDGQDGQDGHTPTIGVKEDGDGILYWTIDGEWLLDENGNKVPVTGKDGENGSDGASGSDGDSFFSGVDTSDPNYVVITLADGSEIKIPTWFAFENLQNTVNQINNNVQALQKIVEALQNNDFVTSVSPIYEDDEVIGYTIIFSKSGAVTIFNGQDGKDGQNGSNGQDGSNGADGHTPVIGVRQDSDGVYYWTVDGEWLLDENGNKLRVTGRDGQDGSDGSNGSNGQDGADGHTPVIGVKQDTDGVYYWTVDGEWLLDENGNKVPTTGRDGADGSNGADGSDGEDGDSFFSSVDTSDSNYVIITLSDGTEIKLPTWKAFEDLQNTVNQINNNVNSLQQIVEALQNNDYVTSVTPIYEGGNVVGYTIIFSKSGAVSIFNGKDGQNGSNGQDGTNGADGHTPVIGVRQDSDGVYYWTIDGEWLLDENGNKLRVTGRDGQDGSNGSNGQDGADGHTPVIGVKQDTDGVYYWTVDGEWLLDENGNKVPTTGRDGADGSNGTDGSDGQDGDSFFSSVDTSDSNYVIITLSDGTEIKLPTWKAFEDLQNTVNQINNNVNALQQIVEALQNNDYVTSVTPIYEGGNVVGYTIIFSKSGAFSIFNGKDGQNGSNGQDGTNGTDGHTPVIGVRQDTDGVYYWTVDGEWLLDENGNKLRVTGRDGSNGSNGSNGQDGADGHTPVIGVKQDTDGVYYWTVDGEWLLDENGNKVPTTGRDGSNGADGSDGQDGDSFFSSVDTSDSNYVIITLSDGTEIKLPTWKAFEDLQNTVNQINNNVNSLQHIVEALQNNDYVTSVTPIYEGGNVVGYTIIFSKSGAVSIFNGKDGQNGSNGQDGTNGADGHTPVIGVRQDTDGVYYWTVDGEWLLDENGNKLRVTGRDCQDGSDGSNGSNGQDGADGHTPVIGVKQDTDGVYYWTVDGEWLLDENGNKVPTTGRDGADGSDGQDGDSFFSSVTENDKYISLILADGTEIILPKYPKAPVTLTLGTVTGFTATFNGAVHQKSLDLKVTVYYSTTPDLTVYKHRGSLAHTEFPTDSFVMKLKELAANTTYYYFVEIVGNGNTSYSEISSFRTTEPDSYVDWGDGENVGGEI